MCAVLCYTVSVIYVILLCIMRAFIEDLNCTHTHIHTHDSNVALLGYDMNVVIIHKFVLLTKSHNYLYHYERTYAAHCVLHHIIPCILSNDGSKQESERETSIRKTRSACNQIS